jgi:hypothetical protein
VNRNARELMRRKSMTSCEPAMKPPQLASDFENVPIRRSTSASTPKSSLVPAPRAPSTPGGVRLVDHQPRAVRLAQLDDPRQVGDVALHREDAVDDHEHAAAVLAARSSIFSSLSSRPVRNGRSLARERRQPSRIDAWSPSRRSPVSPGARIVPSGRRWPGGRS